MPDGGESDDKSTEQNLIILKDYQLNIFYATKSKRDVSGLPHKCWHFSFFAVLFQSNYACIHQTTFIDHGKETICLYEIGLLCNTTRALCDIRIALCDMDPL